MSDVPTFIKPARVDVIEGSGIGGLVLIAAVIAAAAAVLLFALAHLELLAVCAAVFAAVMAAVIVAMRRAASPHRWAEYRYPRPVATVPAARPARTISARQPKAIGAAPAFDRVSDEASIAAAQRHPVSPDVTARKT